MAMVRLAPMFDLGPAFWPTGMVQPPGPACIPEPGAEWAGPTPEAARHPPARELDAFEKAALDSPFSLLRALGEGSRGVITNLSLLGLPDSRVHMREAQGKLHILLGSSNLWWKLHLEDRREAISAALGASLGTPVELTVEQDGQ